MQEEQSSNRERISEQKMENKLEERTTAETFSDYANLLWRWAWLLVLSALLAGGTAYWVSIRQTRVKRRLEKSRVPFRLRRDDGAWEIGNCG